MSNNRDLAYALLRITMGVVFLFYGVGKFLAGFGDVASAMTRQFAGKLPSVLVIPFVYVLPFVEVVLGTLLILGLFHMVALVLAGTLMILLTLGSVMQPSPETVAHNVSFAVVIFLLLWLVEHNTYSLDRLRRSK